MKYPFEVYRMNVEGHEFWAAESKSLKGCVAQGDTCQEALDELELNETEWLSTAQEYGIEIPQIPFEKAEGYSGKFTVRVSSDVHQMAAERAKKLGISLNQYVNDAIVTMNTKEILSEGFKLGVESVKNGMRNALNNQTQISRASSFEPFGQVHPTRSNNIFYLNRGEGAKWN